MDYIYSRVSTEDQTNSNQLVALRADYPHATVVEETGSGAKCKPELELLLTKLIKGDRLIVYALDRLGRHARSALGLLEELERRGVVLVSKREGLDMATTTGRFVAHVMLGFAEMERNIISERTRMALAARKARDLALGIPPQVGGPPRLTQEVWQRVIDYRVLGATQREIAQLVGIAPSTVYRILSGKGKTKETWEARRAERAARRRDATLPRV